MAKVIITTRIILEGTLLRSSRSAAYFVTWTVLQQYVTIMNPHRDPD